MGCCQSTPAPDSSEVSVEPAQQAEPVPVVPQAAPASKSDAPSKIDHPLYEKWESVEHPVFTADDGTWKSLGGTKLEPLLDDLDLVDLAFIIENAEAGLPVPRWQDVPKGARINKSNMYRIQEAVNSYALSVLVLSYPWLDPGHPDKQCATINNLLPCFRAFYQGATAKGEGRTIGLMMDYPCLPQRLPEGEDDRTAEEKGRFKRALGSINEWYMHPYTTTLIYDVDLPGDDSGHTNLRPYTQRGWCTFEFRASCLVKSMFCLWSLQGYIKGGSCKSWGAAVQDAKGKVLRAAPMTPEKFGNLLRNGVQTGEIAFTSKADSELVIDQYHKAFHKAFAETRDLMYQTLQWPDDKILELAEALTYAREQGLLEKTSMVRIWGNKWTEVGKKAVEESIKGLSITLCAT